MLHTRRDGIRMIGFVLKRMAAAKTTPANELDIPPRSSVSLIRWRDRPYAMPEIKNQTNSLRGTDVRTERKPEVIARTAYPPPKIEANQYRFLHSGIPAIRPVIRSNR
jgi:hypothetical protein